MIPNLGTHLMCDQTERRTVYVSLPVWRMALIPTVAVAILVIVIAILV